MTTPEPHCRYCFDKGYYTRCYDEIGSDDGGEGYVKRAIIEKVPCSRCKRWTKVPKEWYGSGPCGRCGQFGLHVCTPDGYTGEEIDRLLDSVLDVALAHLDVHREEEREFHLALLDKLEAEMPWMSADDLRRTFL